MPSAPPKGMPVCPKPQGKWRLPAKDAHEDAAQGQEGRIPESAFFDRRPGPAPHGHEGAQFSRVSFKHGHDKGVS